MPYTYRKYDSYSKPLSVYTNEIVQCGGKRGDSVKIQQTTGIKFLKVSEMSVWGREHAVLLNCYNSDDQCGRFNDVDSLSYL